MRKIFILLDKMIDERIPHCLQTRVADNYYNLATDHPVTKKQVFLSNCSLEVIEEQLYEIWGHLLVSKTKVIKTSAPLSAPIPIPPPMPIP